MSSHLKAFFFRECNGNKGYFWGRKVKVVGAAGLNAVDPHERSILRLPSYTAKTAAEALGASGVAVENALDIGIPLPGGSLPEGSIAQKVG